MLNHLFTTLVTWSYSFSTFDSNRLFLAFNYWSGNRLILSLPNMITKTGWGLVGLLAFYYVMRIVFSIVAYDSGLPSGIFLPILTMGA